MARRGWGEFPIHVQIHFKDARNKRLDINHNLKLDWTQTGLQTFGGETSCCSKLVLKPNDFVDDSAIQSVSKIKNSPDPQESKDQESETKLQEESPSISLQNELNTQYSMDSFQQNGLPRNFSSSSLSSTSNSNLFSPLINQNIFSNVNPSPTNFISADLESHTTQVSNTISNNQLSNNNFDELLQNLSTDKKQEEKKLNNQGPKSNGTSLDALLNLRPKSIQLNKQLTNTNLVIPPKILQPNITSKIVSSVNSKIVTPGISQVNSKQSNISSTNNSFLNSLNKKLVIYKVGSEDVSPKSQINENENDKSSKLKILNTIFIIKLFKYHGSLEKIYLFKI